MSVDSDGFPSFLKEDNLEDETPCERAPKYRNLGRLSSVVQWSKSQEQRQLKMSLGFDPVLPPVSKRPACAIDAQETQALVQTECG